MVDLEANAPRCRGGLHVLGEGATQEPLALASAPAQVGMLKNASPPLQSWCCPAAVPSTPRPRCQAHQARHGTEESEGTSTRTKGKGRGERRSSQTAAPEPPNRTVSEEGE